MGYRIAADLTAMVHFLFVIFVFGLLYPSGLDRQTQILLAMLVLGLNAIIYGFAVRRKFFRSS